MNFSELMSKFRKFTYCENRIYNEAIWVNDGVCILTNGKIVFKFENKFNLNDGSYSISNKDFMKKLDAGNFNPTITFNRLNSMNFRKEITLDLSKFMFPKMKSNDGYCNISKDGLKIYWFDLGCSFENPDVFKDDLISGDYDFNSVWFPYSQIKFITNFQNEIRIEQAEETNAHRIHIELNEKKFGVSEMDILIMPINESIVKSKMEYFEGN